MIRRIDKLFLIILGVLFLSSSAWGVPSLKLPFQGGESWVLTCGYGCGFHTTTNNGYYSLDFDKVGINEDQEPGEPVLAPMSGVVAFANLDGAFGYSVKIDDGNGYVARVAHLRYLPAVSVGDQVSQGQFLGIMGGTESGGNKAYNDHVHIQVYYSGTNIAPEPMSDNDTFIEGLSYLSDNYYMPQNSTYVKSATNPNIYYVFKNQLWLVKDEATFYAMGNSDFSEVVEYEANRFNQITNDYPISGTIVDEGLVAKALNSSNVYRFYNGEWHWFQDWSVFTSYGYNDDNIVDITSAVFNMYPEGSSLSVNPDIFKISLNHGWNYRIGHNFTRSISGNSSAITITRYGQELPIVEAIDQRWMYSRYAFYDSYQGQFLYYD